MSWVDTSDKPTGKQIEYSEKLLEKCFGEIVQDVYSMNKSEISLAISVCKEKYDSGKSLVL